MSPTEASRNSAVVTRLAKGVVVSPFTHVCSKRRRGGSCDPWRYVIVLPMFAFVGYNQSVCSCDQVASIRACAYGV